MTKRLFDITASLLGIIITSPLWLLAIIGIEISDPGPVFYLARRSGKDGKVFRMFKFRSMRVDSSANESSLRPDSERIFAFGEFIRRMKIDELPQLLNVLNGTMSVVGPRPASVDQVEITRSGRYAIVASVPCGLTGPSALYDYIWGDRFTDEAEYVEKVLPGRLELDRFYVMNACPSYDIRLIWQTVVCIVYSAFGKFPQGIYDELVRYSKGDNS